MHKVTVIVPIYNVEQYLDRLISSIMHQTYSNIQIILVDDGSPDNSPAIVDRYANIDERILAIHKKNGGVSSARNAGLELADGDYVMFIDGDDYVDEDYVEYFVDLVTTNHAEVGYGKYFRTIGYDMSGEAIQIIDSDKAMEWIYDGVIGVAVWNKIYDMSIIRRNQICFNEGVWYGEGMLFNIEILQYTDMIVVGEKAVYHQSFNPDSAVNSFKLNSNYCGISSMWLQRAIWKDASKNVYNAWRFHKYRYNMTILEGMVRTNNLDRDVYRECVSNIRRGILIPLRYHKGKKIKLKCLAYSVAPYFMANRDAKKYENNVLKSRTT